MSVLIYNLLKDSNEYTSHTTATSGDAVMTIDGFAQVLPPNLGSSFNIKIWHNLAAATDYYNNQNDAVEPLHVHSHYASIAELTPYVWSLQDTPNAQTVPGALLLKHIFEYLGTVQPEVDGVNWSHWKNSDPTGVPQIKPTQI